MWQSLQEFVVAVFRHWKSLCFGVAGVFLAVGDKTIEGFHVPKFVWIAIVVVGGILAMFLAFHDLRKERDSLKAANTTPPPVQVVNNFQPVETPPEWSIYDAFIYITNQTTWLNGRNLNDHGVQLELLHELSQAAFDGKITIWGRPLPELDYTLDKKVRMVPLPGDYWRGYDLDLSCLLPPTSEKAGRTKPNGRTDSGVAGSLYGDLHVDRVDVQIGWTEFYKG